jgi:hypothetical protein
LIIPILVSSSLFVTPVKDTVWWDTPGGTVTEHRDQAGVTCSLMLYDAGGSVVFEWGDAGRTLVTAIDWDWQLPDNWKMPVAMQIGDEWLSNGGDSAVIQAVGHGNAVTFAVNQPVDDLIRRSNHIEVKTTGTQLSITLNPAKNDALLSRARRCRGVIGK